MMNQDHHRYWWSPGGLLMFRRIYRRGVLHRWKAEQEVRITYHVRLCMFPWKPEVHEPIAVKRQPPGLTNAKGYTTNRRSRMTSAAWLLQRWLSSNWEAPPFVAAVPTRTDQQGSTQTTLCPTEVRKHRNQLLGLPVLKVDDGSHIMGQG